MQTITNTTLAHHNGWQAACGGTETPFSVKGRKLHYLWNRITKEHAYYDIDRDLFLSDEEAFELLNSH